MPHWRAAAFALSLLLVTPISVQAQYIGSGSCGGSECHQKREIPWWSKQQGGREHKNSLDTLTKSADRSQKYAQALKLQNPMDPKGMCMQCHGTPQLVQGVPEGVGCEGCHNPAAKWKPYHANNYKPENYKQSVSLGMADLKGNTKQWVKVCTDCHVLDGKSQYDALVEEGHPDGRRWAVEKKYQLVAAHWKPTTQAAYTPDKVKGGVAVAVAAPDPPPPPPPPPGPTTTPGPETPKTGTESPKPGPTPGPPTKAAPKASPRPPTPTVSSPPPADPVPSAPLPRVDASPLTLPPPQPTTPAEMLGALQSRVAAFLTRLLRDNVTPSQPLEPLRTPPRVSGPDAELLQLQAEALALAIEALNLKTRAPQKPSDK